jgi:hypothetical protein
MLLTGWPEVPKTLENKIVLQVKIQIILGSLYVQHRIKH